MAALAEDSNVYNTVLLLIKKMGFQVWFNKEADLYCAEKDGWDFMSDSPTGLLGLISVYEKKQPTIYKEYWWREEGPEIYRHLPDQAVPYRPIWKKR